MITFQQAPVPALRPFIDRLWGWEAAPGESIALPALLPGTGAELYFHYGAPFRPRVAGVPAAPLEPGHLLCLRRAVLDLAPQSGAGFVAVRFKAGAVCRFVPMTESALRDEAPSFSLLWGPEGRILRDRLSDAADRIERAGLLQCFLLARLRPEAADPWVEAGMALAYREGGRLRMDGLAGRLGLGRRQLERRWRALTGQSPAEFARLARFQRTVRRLMLDRRVRAVDAALEGGYWDQAHFVRDFGCRVGVAPGAWLAAARARTHFYNTRLEAAGMLCAPSRFG
ncbi:Transcriptional regulator, AraC family OS=Castellaniella defragrans (strain DSM / CCUG 39792/ 65Phen) OX=1437824 GN=BN940_17586 PE=4 SV=1 [Castellaniella denitrificans]|uniref:AraC family transcriptional regulator n=1 Tax=Castellaniella sp. TaxID=1955812 RepID=UPI003D14F1A6